MDWADKDRFPPLEYKGHDCHPSPNAGHPVGKKAVKDIEHWKREGFAFEARFPNEYDLWVNRKTMQKLRRYVGGREWLSDLTTGEYALVQDTPNAEHEAHGNCAGSKP